MKHIHYWLGACVLAIAVSCKEPTRNLEYTGQVFETCDSQTPLAGVEISYGYSILTTTTGADGRFSLKGSESIELYNGGVNFVSATYNGVFFVISPEEHVEEFHFGKVYLFSKRYYRIQFINVPDSLDITSDDILTMYSDFGNGSSSTNRDFQLDPLLMDGNVSPVLSMYMNGSSEGTFNGLRLSAYYRDRETYHSYTFESMSSEGVSGYPCSSDTALFLMKLREY